MRTAIAQYVGNVRHYRCTLAVAALISMQMPAGYNTCGVCALESSSCTRQCRVQKAAVIDLESNHKNTAVHDELGQ